MSEPLVAMPPDGWSVDALDALPESHYRYKLTDGALTVSPSPSSLHQFVAAPTGDGAGRRGGPSACRDPGGGDPLRQPTDPDTRCVGGPSALVRTPRGRAAVEIESPGSHVEDRVTKPALYAAHGIEHYWRVELDSPAAMAYQLAGGTYRAAALADRLVTRYPVAVDLSVADLLPPWAHWG